MQNIITAPSTLSTFIKSATALATGLSMALIVGCSNSEQVAAEGADTDVAAPVGQEIRIATEGAYAPFNYTDAEGNLVGFDVDLVNALCAEMQANCDVVAQDWDGIIPGLKAGKYDAIIAGMSITPVRLEQVDFTEPYFNNSLVFITKDGSTFNPADAASLNGVSIGTQRSTVSSQWLEDNLPEADAKLYDTLTNAFLDLEAGRVDAILSDKAPAIEWLSTDKVGYNIVGDEIDINDTLGIAVRKDDALKQQFDTALETIKSNGTYDTISDKYFNVAND